MNQLVFWIPGEPKGQPRPRATKRGSFVSVYKPKTDAQWVAAIRKEIEKAKVERAFDLPLDLDIRIFMPRPLAHFKLYRGIRTLRSDAPVFHTSRPDADNILKGVSDAATSDDHTVRLWTDDRWVVSGHWTKQYADVAPGVLMIVKEAAPLLRQGDLLASFGLQVNLDPLYRSAKKKAPDASIEVKKSYLALPYRSVGRWRTSAEMVLSALGGCDGR